MSSNKIRRNYLLGKEHAYEMVLERIRKDQTAPIVQGMSAIDYLHFLEINVTALHDDAKDRKNLIPLEAD